MKDEEGVRDLRSRTTEFGVRIVRLCDALPRKRRSSTVIANQLVRCGTAVGAHYRESVRSRSDAEVISKLETALQELDETDYWLELLTKAEIMTARRLAPLRAEANELTAILVTCVKKVKARRKP